MVRFVLYGLLIVAWSCLARTADHEGAAPNAIWPVVSSDFVPHNGEGLPGQGPAVALTQAIFQSQGVRTQVQFLPWPRALKIARSGQAAAILTLWYDDERSQDLIYPTPLYQNEMVFLQNNRAPLLATPLEALKNSTLRLGLVRGYSYPAVVRAAQAQKIELLSDHETLEMLVRQRVDFVVAERWVADHIIRTELSAEKAAISTVGPVLERKPMYIAFSRHYPGIEQLVAQYEAGLRRPEVQQLRRQLLKAAPYPPE